MIIIFIFTKKYETYSKLRPGFPSIEWNHFNFHEFILFSISNFSVLFIIKFHTIILHGLKIKAKKKWKMVQRIPFGKFWMKKVAFILSHSKLFIYLNKKKRGIWDFDCIFFFFKEKKNWWLVKSHRTHRYKSNFIVNNNNEQQIEY